MGNHRLSRVLALLPIAAACAAATGCSLIGLGIGAAVDSQNKDREIPGWELTEVEPGAPISLLLVDGSRISGRLGGVELIPPSDYASRYAEARRALGSQTPLPALGPGARLLGVQGGSGSGQLLGFTTRGVVFHLEGRADPIHYPYEKVAELSDAEGVAIDGTALRSLVGAGRLPLSAQLILDVGGQSQRIPLDRVTQATVRAKHKGHAKLVGFLIGAAVDVVVVVSVLNDPWLNTDNCDPNSCPYVYSDDGRGYRLDSEVFGGAIFEKAERTAWDRLDHLVERDGAYRIRIANELRETQYLDGVTLLAVDHARGTQVIPSFTGEAVVIQNPRSPTAAVDSAGRNVLPLVKAPDQDVWLANPFGRDPEDPSQVRDAVTLDFRKSPGRESAKLVLHVRNTLWASFLRRKGLELLGSDLDVWYARMNASAEARRQLNEATIREGALRVEVWDGVGWRNAGFVWEVGPALPKWQVLRVPVPPGPGPFRVRLSSTVGHWLVDSAQLDDSPDRPIRVTPIAPESARDQTGADVLAIVSARDGRRHAMPTLSDTVALRFPAPPRRPGWERTMILKSSGYYIIHVDASGPPRSAELEELLRRPGAYGQFAVRLLNGYQDRSLSRIAAR